MLAHRFPTLLKSASTTSTSTTARTFSTTRPTSLARMQLIGRLAATPELTPTSTGRDIVRYAIGTTHRTSRGEETSWFRVASFVDEGARRDLVLGLPKGTLVYLEGDAKMSTFTDAESKRQSRLDLVERTLDVLALPQAEAESRRAARAAAGGGQSGSEEDQAVASA